jgi:hypothetical protein
MQVEITVNVVLEHKESWATEAAYALQDIGRVISTRPEFIENKGEGSFFTFDYTIRGVE